MILSMRNGVKLSGTNLIEHPFGVFLFFVFCIYGFSFSEESPSQKLSAQKLETGLTPQTRLASVNGKDIIFHDISEKYYRDIEKIESAKASCSPVMQHYLLLRLFHEKIEEILFLEEAERKSLQVPEKEVQEAWSHVKEKFKEASAFQLFLKKNGVSEQDLKRKIQERLKVKYLQDQLIRETPSVSDQEVDIFIKEHQDDISPPEGYHLSQILLQYPQDHSESLIKQIKNRMEEIRKEIMLRKTDFEKMARLYSQGFSAPSGGIIGWVTRSQPLDPVLIEEIKKMKTGEISSVISTPDSVHLLKLNAYRPPSIIKEKELRKTIYEQLMKSKKMETLRRFIEDAVQHAQIRIYYEPLEEKN
jgi:parvulin-like peptidyl-prolyl isomerase